MAVSQKISQKTEITEPERSDVLPIVNSSTTKKVTAINLLKNRPYVVVGASGIVDYKCDGAADQVEIQQAIDAVSASGGGVIFLKEGTYSVTDSIEIPSNITLQGEGWTTIIQAASAMGSILRSKNHDAHTGDDNIIIKDMLLDANLFAGNGAHEDIILMDGDNILIDYVKIIDGSATNPNMGIAFNSTSGNHSKNGVIKNCFIDNIQNKGIGLSYCDNFVIKNNYVEDCNGQSIWTNACSYTEIDGNITYNNEDGIWSSYDSVKSIIKNNIIHCTTTVAQAISVLHDLSDSCVVTDNIIYQARYGITIMGKNHVVKGNIISGVTLSYIVIDRTEGNVEGILIKDNILYCNGASSYAIHAATHATNYIRSIKIDGNYIYEPNDTGIRIIAGNTNCKNVDVTNNTVIGANDYGIRHEVRYSNISGNTVKNSAVDGIFLNSQIDCRLENNHCYDDQDTKTQLYGINNSGGTTDYNIYIGNNVRGNKTGGMNLLGSNNEISHNIGYTTRNSGTGTIANGATSTVITHGLSVTPSAEDIFITLKEDPTNTPGAIYVDTITSTQFTVHCENDPGASGLDFGWRAIAE